MADELGVLDELDLLLLLHVGVSVGGHLLVCAWKVTFLLISGLDIFEGHWIM